MIADSNGVSWTDVGTFVTGVVALVVVAIAAVFAGWQVWEARRLREAQFRPFVILDFSYYKTFAQLTIKNIGATLARDVTFEPDPPWKTSLDNDPDYAGAITPITPWPAPGTSFQSVVSGEMKIS